MSRSRTRSISHPFALAAAVGATFGLPALIVAVSGSPRGPFDDARVAAWACCVLGLLALVGCVGVEIRGRVGGALIDERNRYSLSRLQMLAWTTLLVSSLYTLIVANALRGDPALKIMDIAFDWNLVAAAGFSLVSLVGAPMALSRKADAPSAAGDLQKANAQLGPQQDLSAPVSAVGRVLVKATPEDARLADLFRGEDVQNAALVDTARLQMLLVSTLVILGYGIALVVHLATPVASLQSLPSFSSAVLGLILVSHAGYLTGKIVPSSPASASTAADQAAQVLAVARSATDISARVDAFAAQTPPASPQLARLNQVLVDARSAAADANAWNSNAAQARATDPATLAQRVAAAQGALAAIVAQRNASTDAPDPSVVRKVQDRLAAKGFAVTPTGADDPQTHAAIDRWMTQTRTDPTSLAARRQRFYEELEQLV